ncbi:MAG: DUF7313 family protein [archaeon]
MSLLQFAAPIGAIESVSGELPYVILALVLVNLVTRHLAHRRHKQLAADGAESMSRFGPHVAVSAVLVFVCFLFMVVEPHSGMVISVLAVGTVLADFFEFEARLVEARNNLEIEAPKAAITTSIVTLLYAAYLALFWIVREQWTSIV